LTFDLYITDAVAKSSDVECVDHALASSTPRLRHEDAREVLVIERETIWSEELQILFLMRFYRQSLIRLLSLYSVYGWRLPVRAPRHRSTRHAVARELPFDCHTWLRRVSRQYRQLSSK
jgi:hypothetical protein